MSPRYAFRTFDAGLWVAPPRDRFPPGTLRRNTGVRNTALSGSIRSRWGLEEIEDFGNQTLHSIVTFHDRRYYGVNNFFGNPMVGLASQFNGKALSFVTGIPTEGKGQPAPGASPEFLFIAGGGDPIKVDDTSVPLRWGINVPLNDFAASPVPFTNGFNFMFWERFDDTLHWVLDENDSIHDLQTDTVNVPPDLFSTACLSFEVSQNRTGRMTHQIFDAGGAPGLIDFRTFGQRPSALQDWIVIDFWVDEPEHLESITLGFSTNGVSAGPTHTFKIIVDDPILRTLTDSPAGIGDIGGVRGDQLSVGVAALPGAGATGSSPGPSDQFFQQAVESTATIKLSSTARTWTRLRIPKTSFQTPFSMPPNIERWQDIAQFEFVITTNRKGGVTIKVDNGSMFGGTGIIGKYKYLITHKNSKTGTRSNPNPTPVEVTNPFRTGIVLTNLPPPSDPQQVDTTEIWRTMGNGTIYLKGAEVMAFLDNFVDRFADHASLCQFSANQKLFDPAGTFVETLGPEEIQFDNIPPNPTMEDVAGPHLGQLFGTRDLEPGSGGRVYWTPAGRLEAWPNFIVVSGDDDPMQKVVVWGGTVYACSESRMWELVGELSYIARPIFGVPGTRFPLTMVATPYGIIYLASDGVRRFDGAQSDLVAPDAVAILFRGETANGLGTFPSAGVPLDQLKQRVKAAYWRDEYFLTDGSKTLVVNLRTGAWRDFGTFFSALYHERDTDLLLGGKTGSAFLVESPGVTTDEGAAKAFHIQIPSVMPNAGIETYLMQRLYVDCNTNGQTLTATIFANDDQAAIQGGSFSINTAQRETVEVSLCCPIGVGYVDIQGMISDEVEISGIEADCHIAESPGDGT